MTEQVSAQGMGAQANFGQRLAAFLIDTIILFVVYGIVWAITNEVLASLVYLVLFFVYFSYFEGSESGQTLGKRALGIRVVDTGGGGALGFGRALIRALSRILSQIPCYLGYFWMLWDDRKQTWHDKLASTAVVRTT